MICQRIKSSNKIDSSATIVSSRTASINESLTNEMDVSPMKDVVN